MSTKKLKIVHLSPLSVEQIKQMSGKDLLDKIEITIPPPNASLNEIKNTIKDASIIVGDYTRRIPITRELIEAAKECKLIHQPTVGYETIDIKAAREHGIPVSNNAGMNAVAVAEHAIMMILALLKKAVWMHNETSNGNWLYLEAVSKGWIGELSSRTLGIVGLGNSGKELALRAKVFTPNILYTKRNRLSPEQEEKLGVSYRSFEDLLGESDVVSLHVPLTDETRGLIGVKELALMRDNAVLLNLARAGVMDYGAVADAVRSGKLSGVGVDVFESEPVGVDCPLIGLRNVILSPHLGGSTFETGVRGRRMVQDNIWRIVNGREPFNIVN